MGTKIDLKVIKEADLGKKSRKITTSSPQKSNKGSLCILECNRHEPRRSKGEIPRARGLTRELLAKAKSHPRHRNWGLEGLGEPKACYLTRRWAVGPAN